MQCGPRGLPGEARPPLPQRRRRHASPRSARRRASPIRARYFGLGVAWFDYNDDGWPDLYVANDSTPNFLYLNQKDGTFKEIGVPDGRGGERGRRRAGQHGRGASATTTTAAGFSLFVTNFAEEYNALYRNEGDHFTDVSFRSKTAAEQPALRGLGHGVLRLRQRRLARHHRRSTATSTRSSTRRGCGASAGYRQRKLLYHNRGDGTFDEVARAVRAGAHRGAREPRPRRGRPRRRRPPRRRDQRPRRQRRRCCATSSPAPATGCSSSSRARAEHRRDRRRGHASRRAASRSGGSCRAGRATSRRTTCAGTSASGAAGAVEALEVRWPDGTTTSWTT